MSCLICIPIGVVGIGALGEFRAPYVKFMLAEGELATGPERNVKKIKSLIF